MTRQPMVERADGWERLWRAEVDTPSGRALVRVLSKYIPASDEDERGRWAARIDHGAEHVAPDVEDYGEVMAVARAVELAGAAWRWRAVSLAKMSEPVWVPWPTADGYWWCRDPIVGSLCVVEARVEAESSWIYFSGVECPLYVNEPRAAWEFTPVVAPARPG